MKSRVDRSGKKVWSSTWGKKGRNCTLQLHDCTSATDKKFGTTIFSIHGAQCGYALFGEMSSLLTICFPKYPATSFRIQICIHCLTLGLLFRPLFTATVAFFFDVADVDKKLEILFLGFFFLKN